MSDVPEWFEATGTLDEATADLMSPPEGGAFVDLGDGEVLVVQPIEDA